MGILFFHLGVWCSAWQPEFVIHGLYTHVAGLSHEKDEPETSSVNISSCFTNQIKDVL